MSVLKTRRIASNVFKRSLFSLRYKLALYDMISVGVDKKITVSFFQYPTLSPAAAQRVVADKDGYFSIEFTNVGMSGVKEITNEFSKHGEIVKVQQSGGRNAIKKVSVSYQDMEAAVTAIEHYANSNDVRGIDFVAECLEMEEREASPGSAQ